MALGQQVLGPAQQGWRPLCVELPDGGSFTALVIRRGSTANGFWCMNAQPALVVDDTGRPLFQLTALLKRMPSATEGIAQFVEAGLLNLSVSLGVPNVARLALESALGGPCHAPFLQNARVALVKTPKAGEVLAACQATGINPVAILSATVGRHEAVELLEVIGGAVSGMSVRASVSLAGLEGAVPIHLTGRWTDVYEALRRRAGELLTLSAEELDEELGRLLAVRTIIAEPNPPNAPSQKRLRDVLVRRAAFLLERRPDMSYALGRPPSPWLQLDLTERVSFAVQNDLELGIDLEKLLENVHAGERVADLVALVCVDNSGHFQAVPPLRSSRRTATTSSFWLAQEKVLIPLTLAMTPDRGATISDDMGLESDAGRSSRGTWRAPQANAKLRVQADGIPQLEVVTPRLADDPATSAFRFRFTSAGVVLGAEKLSIGLRAEVRLTVRFETPNDRGISYPTGPFTPQIGLGFAASLELPFRVSGTNEIKSQRFVAQMDSGSDPRKGLTFTVQLLDDWARLAYGALAYPNIQTQSARFIFVLSYPSYESIAPDQAGVVFGGKTARIDIADASAHVQPPFFDPADYTFQTRDAVLQFEREPSRRTGGGKTFTRGTITSATTTHAPVPFAPIPTSHSGAVIRPQLMLGHEVLGSETRNRQVPGITVVERTVDVLMPCSTYGAFYRQTDADGTERAVGCQDVLRLGEINYRQYEELPQLRDPRYRVFRSLQQPGRFLVLPASYRITRYGSAEPSDRAFRPIILLYGIIGGLPTENRYFLSATLEPDIPYFARRALAASLVPFAPYDTRVVLDYPTDPAVQSKSSFRWALPTEIEEPYVTQAWNTFQVSVSTGLTNALALTTMIESVGLNGQVAFALPDGLTLRSDIQLDTHVVGPWESGPVQVIFSGANARIQNQTEQAVNVTEVEVGLGTDRFRRIPANVELAAGGAIELKAIIGEVGQDDDIVIIYDPVPQNLSLEQLNVFVEDIKTNVVFVNLINYMNHGLASLELTAHLKSTSHDYTITLGDGQNGQIDLTLPLTTYLSTQILEFQLVQHLQSGLVTAMPWLSWDLNGQGAIISIVPEMIERHEE